MANHEKKEYCKSIDLLLAFARKKCGQDKAKCIRTVIRDFDTDLALLECRVKRLGGEWRIHQTVNKRDTEKARIWLIKKLIDFPEGAGFIDSLWRTALLQKECIYGKKRFLLDIDTKDKADLQLIEALIVKNSGKVKERIKTVNGWHYITSPFDTREICKLDNVSLIRDGYFFVKQIKESTNERE